jgi:hypothetical protein
MVIPSGHGTFGQETGHWHWNQTLTSDTVFSTAAIRFANARSVFARVVHRRCACDAAE